MKKILVVVDMQNDFISGALGTKEAQAIVPNVVKKINNHNGDIFVTLDTHKGNYLDTLEGKHLPVPHCIENTDGWWINDDIRLALFGKQNFYIEKPTFGSMELVYELQDYALYNDIEIELVGLCTDICVVSNALLLKANLPEVEITVDASCCAGVTTETNEAAIATMKMCHVNVIGE